MELLSYIASADDWLFKFLFFYHRFHKFHRFWLRIVYAISQIYY